MPQRRFSFDWLTRGTPWIVKVVRKPLGSLDRFSAPLLPNTLFRHCFWPVLAVGFSVQPAAGRYRGIEILAPGSHRELRRPERLGFSSDQSEADHPELG